MLALAAAQLTNVRADNATGNAGTGGPINNRQPTLVMRWIIAKEGGIFPNDDPNSSPNGTSSPDRSIPFLGEIKAVPFNFAPRGWEFCEGQLLPINQNQALFGLIGTTYGGNGQTNFALPDLRGRTIMGAGQGPGLPNYTVGQQAGNEPQTLTRANLPPHTHSLPGGGTTQVTGNGVPVDNRQPAIAMNFLIGSDGGIVIAPWPQQPTGWARCDGRLLPRIGHTFLFNHFGNLYGGDGNNNFALPDLRGRVVIGDDGTVDGWNISRKHGVSDNVLAISDIKAHTHSTSAGNTGSTGGGVNTTNNYQLSLVLRWVISFAGDVPSQDSGAEFPCVGEMRLLAGGGGGGFGDWTTLFGDVQQISDHVQLFNLIGTTYGGDGQTTFAVPDLRARVVEHVSSGVPLATSRGQSTLTVSLSEIATHAHLIDLRIDAIQHFADGTAQLNLSGMPGSSVQVDSSTDLTTWTNLGTVQFTTASQTITDPNPTQASKRFYQAHP